MKLLQMVFLGLVFFSMACGDKARLKDDPYIKAPEKVQAKVGRLMPIVASTNGKKVKWFSASDENDLIVSESSFQAIFCATKPGDYRVFLYTSLNDVLTDPYLCVVTVTGSEPTPIPPAPIPPVPVPVDPVSMFESNLKAIVVSTVDPKKNESMKSLASVYEKLSVAAQDEKYKTIRDLYEYGMKLSLASLDADAISGIRSFIGGYLDGLAPTSTAQAINKGDRDLFAKEFKMISDVLIKLSK